MDKKRELTELQKKSLLIKRNDKVESTKATDVLKKPLVKVTIALVVVYGAIVISRLFVKEVAELVTATKKLNNARKL